MSGKKQINNNKKCSLYDKYYVSKRGGKDIGLVGRNILGVRFYEVSRVGISFYNFSECVGFTFHDTDTVGDISWLKKLSTIFWGYK